MHWSPDRAETHKRIERFTARPLTPSYKPLYQLMLSRKSLAKRHIPNASHLNFYLCEARRKGPPSPSGPIVRTAHAHVAVQVKPCGNDVYTVTLATLPSALNDNEILLGEPTFCESEGLSIDPAKVYPVT